LPAIAGLSFFIAGLLYLLRFERVSAFGVVASFRSTTTSPASFMLDEIESLSEHIREYNDRVQQIAQESYPEVARLEQVKGVGTLIALTYVLTLEDPGRFRKSRDVACYVGLQPGRRNSGQNEPQLHISKEGDPYLRTMMVQSAHHILGPFGADSDLRRWGLKLAERGGKNGKKRAVIAVARKLAVLLHRFVGERWGVRSAAQKQSGNAVGGSLSLDRNRSEPQAQAPSSGDCVYGLAHFHRKMEREVDKQVAASAETRTPNLHRARNRSPKSADGRVATVVARNGHGWFQLGNRVIAPNEQSGPPSFLAEWWQSGPRRQGSAYAAQNAPLTAPGRSANPPPGRKVDLWEGQIKIYLT
jgi:Transposase IS116/IS110/IS902 family